MEKHQKCLYNYQQEDQEHVEFNTGCFHRLLCFKWQQAGDADSQSLLKPREVEKKESWFEQKLKRVQEVSEVFAGPKWKNFIRKLGAYFSEGKCKRNKFQYDSHSYALNFDHQEQENNGQFFTGFSVRFAPVLKHNRSTSGISM